MRTLRTRMVCAGRRGFTLIELVMALVVTSVLIGAVGSLVVMTARAANGNPKSQPTAAGTADSLARLESELACALTISGATATGLTMTIPDRTGDGQPETITYAWAGPGSALTRSEGAKAAVEVTGRLSDFALRYATTSTAGSKVVDQTTMSDEVLMASFTGWTGITPTYRELGVTASVWGSEYFRLDAVAFPATLTRIDITRVRLMLRRGTTGNVTVGIQGVGTVPTTSGTAIGTPDAKGQVALETTQRWETFTFGDVTFASEPKAGLCLVVKGTGTTSGYLRYLDSISAPDDTPQFLFSSNSGSTWAPSTSLNRYDAPFEVYGRYQYTTKATVDTTVYRVKSVDIRAQSQAATTPLATTVRTLNTPTGTGPAIEK